MFKTTTTRALNIQTYTTETNEICEIKNDHNHDVDVIDPAVREVRHKLREAATSATEAPKRIVTSAIDGLSHEVLQNLPSDAALNKYIYSTRKAKSSFQYRRQLY